MSESARISRMLSGIKNCEISNSIQRARAIYGSAKPCCDEPTTSIVQTPLESDLLAKKVVCLTYVDPAIRYGTETQRILSKIDHSLDLSQPYTGPRTLPVCPATPTILMNANLPKPSTRCPLPNKPSLPLFPV